VEIKEFIQTNKRIQRGVQVPNAELQKLMDQLKKLP